MRSRLSTLLFFILGLGAYQAKAQFTLPPLQPEQEACNAIELCGTSFTTPYTYQGIGQTQEMNIGACITENASMWLKVTVATAGNIVFTITPINQYDDYDFVVLNLMNASCNSFSYSNIWRCNGNNNYLGSSPGGVIGLNYTSTLINVPGGTFGSPFNQFIAANAGDVFLIMIDNSGNYSNPASVSAGFTIDFAGSTATFAQPPAPLLTSIAPACDKSNSIKVNLSKPVKCSSIAADGSDFSLSPSGSVVSAVGLNCGLTPNGYTSQITLTFGAPLAGGNYVLNAQTGTDANTLLDICNSALQIPDTLHFTVLPNNLQMIRLDTPACNHARIITNSPISCATVAANGTDFKVTGPSGVSVTAATPVGCNAQGMTDTIDVFFNGSIPVPGTYILSVVSGTDGNPVTDTCGRSIINTISWVVSDKGYVTASVSPDVLCEPGYVMLTGAPTNGLPPGFTYDYTWAGPYVDDSIQAVTQAYAKKTTTYTFRILDSNRCYRRADATVTVSERSPSLLPDHDSAICIGNYVQLQAAGGVTYNWMPTAGLSCTGCPDPIASPQSTTTYSVSIADQYGCADTLSRTVIVNPLPLVDAGPDTTVIWGTPLQLLAFAPGGMWYSWDPATNLNNSVVYNPILIPHETTTFTVTVIDTNLCVSSDDIRVTVRTDLPVFIPSAFSPNGDGLNDVFSVKNITIQRLSEFRVFNRWGREVFSTTDAAAGWDGTFKGQPQELGTYSYLIRVVWPDGIARIYKGEVTLVR